MFKFVLFLSLKYFFYCKDSLETLLLEIKISEKLREAAAPLGSPLAVSTAILQSQRDQSLCRSVLAALVMANHGRRDQCQKVQPWHLTDPWKTLHGLSCSLLWYPQPSNGHSHVQIQSQFILTAKAGMSFGFLVISQVLFWDCNQGQVSIMWQCWWCFTSCGPSKPAGWAKGAISCLKQNDVQQMSGIRQRSSNILYQLHRKDG